MHSAPAEEILRRNKHAKELLNKICQELVRSEFNVNESSERYLKFWREQWEWIEFTNQADQGAILSFLRFIITRPESPSNPLINSLFAYKSLHATFHGGVIVSNHSGHSELHALYRFLQGSRLPGKLSEFERDLLGGSCTINGITLATEYLESNPSDPTALRNLLSHALNINGRDDFIALLGWSGWTGRFDQREHLPLLWPDSLQSSVGEAFFKKFPKRYRQKILADKNLRNLLLRKDFLAKIGSDPLSVRDTHEARFSELSAKRFIKHPLGTLLHITQGKTPLSLLKVIWTPAVLGKIKSHAKRFWSSPWVYKSAPLPARLSTDAFLSKLPPEVHAMVSFLAAKNPADRLGVLCTSLRQNPGIPDTSLLTKEVAEMICSLRDCPKHNDLLVALSRARPTLWSRLFDSLPSSLLQSWCGSSDSELLRWLYAGSSCPRPYLRPFQKDILKALDKGLIRIEGDTAEFLTGIDLAKLPENPSLLDALRVTLNDPTKITADWIKTTWSTQQANDSVRACLAKLILDMPARLQNTLLRQLPDQRSWIRCFVEAGLLKKENAARAAEILRQKIQGKHGTVVRHMLVFLEKNRQDKELSKFRQSLLKILLTDRQCFVEDLARFFPSEVGAMLWETDQATLLLAACGSSRTVDWIARRIPHQHFEEAFSHISSSFSTRPTLSVALEAASRAGIRELPQLVRLAFKRWKSDPKLNRGRVFDDLYHSWKLPKKSGGTRTITAPSPSLKRLQRRILDQVLAYVPVNDCVHGFIRGRSCATNARNHTGKQVVAKLDISSFFPSTPYHLIVKALGKATGGTLSQGALFLLSDICSYQGGLPIGAPTSPTLGNIILSRFDDVLVDRCNKVDVTYTRYADDLVFSGDNRAVSQLGVAKGMLAKLGYSIDPKKELIMRRGMRQTVTGLVVNEEVNLPRRQRRRLRAALHAMKHGRGTHWHGKPANHARIIGLLGYHRGVNPESAARLSEKYLPPDKKETTS